MVSVDSILVCAAFVAMAVSNYLSNKKFFGGRDNKEISDEHPTYVTPDGLTFAIWGLIYLMLLVLVVAQAIPSDNMEALMQQRCPLTGLGVRKRLVLAFLANSVWLPLFNNECFWAALAVMGIYLGLLLSVLSDLSAAKGMLEYVLFTAGVSMNTSWICVAFILSVFFCAGLLGWSDQHGVAGSVPAAAVAVILVAIIGSYRAIRAGDYAWAFVAAWALLGIYRMQSAADAVRFPPTAMSSGLASLAKICSGVVALSLAVGVVLRLVKGPGVSEADWVSGYGGVTFN